MSRAERSPRQIWGMPLLLAASSLAGLVLALLGDGVWDAASWLALGIPVAVAGWCARPPLRPPWRAAGREPGAPGRS